MTIKKMIPSQDEILFTALGGIGEIGMNLYVYGYKGRWLIVDTGVKFADDNLPGIDLVVPDISFLVENRDLIEGIFITHAHEDHIGAIAHLWPFLECPIYATPFTAAIAKTKLREGNCSARVKEVSLGARFDLGPFNLELITTTHSTLEASSLVIRTDVGTVVHSGDWKIDRDPLLSEADFGAFERLGQEGILGFVCDSTNALEEGWTISEGEVRESLVALAPKLKGRIVLACFSSNLTRIETASKMAEATGRRLAVLGRSANRMIRAAKETGYLKDLPPLLDEKEVAELPRDEVLLMVTGSQGESRAALARLSADRHPVLKLTEGDHVIFSSRRIPGNEVAINRLLNRLAEKNVDVITERFARIHCSGHAKRDEIKQMMEWLKPSQVIPVHGEQRHLMALNKLAKDAGASSLVGRTGDVFSLSSKGLSIVDQVHIGRWVIDAGRVVPIDSPVIKDRQRIAHNGALFVTVLLDEEGEILDQPLVSDSGLFRHGTEDDAILEEIETRVLSSVSALSFEARDQDKKIEEAVRKAARSVVKKRLGHERRSQVEVHIIRMESE